MKEELNRNYGKNTEIKKKLDILEYKKKEKRKICYKPIIILSSNNNSINNFRNNSFHLKKNIKAENKTIEINKIMKYKDDDKINDINYNNDNKDNIKVKNDKIILKNDSINDIMKDGMINIPSNLIQIFTEKELKAIFIGLDRNKEKYKQLLKKFEVYYSLVDILEIKHKLELKNKLNRINELEEQIEFLNIKKFEIQADIELYKEQIRKEFEKKDIYNKKVIKIFNQVEDKKKILDKKQQEIKLLKNKLLNLKKLIKKGDLKSIKNEPEIEIEYFSENEESNIINNREEKNKEKNKNKENYLIVNRNVETPKTQGTAYEEDDENEFNNIVIKNSDRFIPKEEHISTNNSVSSSKTI